VSKKVRVEAGQYFKWIEGFTTKKKRIGINLITVTFCQQNQFYTELHQNLCERQLFPVCLVVSFQLAVKHEFENKIL
jgi:hypothetical protein